MREPADADVEVSIIVPAYNESHRLPSSLPVLVNALDQLGHRSEIVVVDDGSCDNTSEVAARLLAGRPDVQLLRLPWNCGKGAAVRAGVSAANGRAIVFLDADLASDIGGLRDLLRALETADVALGSRTARGAVVQGRTIARSVGGAAYRVLVKVFTNSSVVDTQCGFKAFRAPVAKLLFSMTVSTGFGFDVEVLTLASALGFRVVECPIRWTAVDGGHVSVLQHGVGMLHDLQRARRHRRRAQDEAWKTLYSADSWRPDADWIRHDSRPAVIDLSDITEERPAMLSPDGLGAD